MRDRREVPLSRKAVDPMKLLDLEPKFLKVVDDRTSQFVDELAGSDGVMFLCPVCFVTNGGSVGTHSVICWRPNVPQTRDPKPGRWDFQGSGYADLTLVAGSSSVLLHGGCNAHFFVRAGEIVMC